MLHIVPDSKHNMFNLNENRVNFIEATCILHNIQYWFFPSLFLSFGLFVQIFQHILFLSTFFSGLFFLSEYVTYALYTCASLFFLSRCSLPHGLSGCVQRRVNISVVEMAHFVKFLPLQCTVVINNRRYLYSNNYSNSGYGNDNGEKRQ